MSLNFIHFIEQACFRIDKDFQPDDQCLCK